MFVGDPDHADPKARALELPEPLFNTLEADGLVKKCSAKKFDAIRRSGKDDDDGDDDDGDDGKSGADDKPLSRMTTAELLDLATDELDEENLAKYRGLSNNADRAKFLKDAREDAEIAQKKAAKGSGGGGEQGSGTGGVNPDDPDAAPTR